MHPFHDFFSDNQPKYPHDHVALFAHGYLMHFRAGKTDQLSTYLRENSVVLHQKKHVDVLVEKARGDVEKALATDPSLGKHAAGTVKGHYPGFAAITIQRLAHALYEKGTEEFPRALTEWAHAKYGIDIHPGAKIGESFFIDHGTGIVIGETAELGNDCVLYHGVTLGNSSEPAPIQTGKKRHPTLGDDVTVFANATILGGSTVIGHGAKIGASAFVTGSVRAGETIHSFTKYSGETI